MKFPQARLLLTLSTHSVFPCSSSAFMTSFLNSCRLCVSVHAHVACTLTGPPGVEHMIADFISVCCSLQN